MMAAEARSDVHHRVPCCLLRLFDAAAEGFAPWSEFDQEAGRWGVEARRLSSEDLAALVEGSTCEIPTEAHRKLYQDAGDFVRWGRRGGLCTLASYGRPYFSLLARFRWGRVEVEALIEHRTSRRAEAKPEAVR